MCPHRIRWWRVGRRRRHEILHLGRRRCRKTTWIDDQGTHSQTRSNNNPRNSTAARIMANRTESTSIIAYHQWFQWPQGPECARQRGPPQAHPCGSRCLQDALSALLTGQHRSRGQAAHTDKEKGETKQNNNAVKIVRSKNQAHLSSDGLRRVLHDTLRWPLGYPLNGLRRLQHKENKKHASSCSDKTA